MDTFNAYGMKTDMLSKASERGTLLLDGHIIEDGSVQ